MHDLRNTIDLSRSGRGFGLFLSEETVMRILLFVLVVITGCKREHKRCQELWDISHAEKVPVSHRYAEVCCDGSGNVDECMAELWRNNNTDAGDGHDR